MAVYGVSFYGVGQFGPDPATVRPDFSVAPFTSMPLSYSSLYLRWTTPPSSDCAYLRLVRNPRNLPMDEDDGFAGQLAELREEVEHHVGEEENDIFHEAGELLTEEQAERIAEEMQAAKERLAS